MYGIENFDNTSGLYYDFNTAPLVPGMEFWKPITDLSVEGVLPIYLVSDWGRIYDTSTGMFLSQYEDVRGYFQVYLKTIYGSKCKPIYRIVIIEFCGFDPNPERNHVDHINAIKKDNSIYNLRWLTKAENTRAAMDLGLLKRKLTDEDVMEICVMLQNGIPRDDILKFIESKGFTHPKTVFYNIYNRTGWTRISDSYPNFQDYRIRKPAFTDEQVHIICQCLEQNMSHDKILDILGYDRLSLPLEERQVLYTAISHIKMGTTSPNISINYNIDKTNQKKLFSEDQIHRICEMLEEHKTGPEILTDIGLGEYAYKSKSNDLDKYYSYNAAISRIRNHQQYKNISSQYNF